MEGKEDVKNMIARTNAGVPDREPAGVLETLVKEST